MQSFAFLWFELRITQQYPHEKIFVPGGDRQCCSSEKVGLKNED
jgi:hypothetical protein